MCKYSDRLLELAQIAEESQRSSFEASQDFIHQYASTVHSRAAELQAVCLSKDAAFRQAAEEKNNLKLEKLKKSD